MVTLRNLTLTFAFPEIVYFMLIIRMVWISRIQEIELRISKFILPDASFKFRSISRYKTSGFIDDIYVRQENIVSSLNVILKSFFLKGYFSPREVDRLCPQQH